MRIRNSILLLIIFCISIDCFGQSNSYDVKLILQKIALRYNGSDEQITYKYQLILQENDNGKINIEKVNAQCTSYKNNFYMKMGTSESYVNGDYSLFVDHETDAIVLSPSQNTPTNFIGIMAQLNSIDTENIRLKKLKSGTNDLIRVYNSEHYFDEIDSLDIVYNPKSFQLSSMKLYYNRSYEQELITLNNKGPQLTMEFLSETRTKSPNSKLFFATEYLEKNERGQYVLTNKSSNFQFYNQLNQ